VVLNGDKLKKTNKAALKVKHAKIHKLIDTYLQKRSYSRGGWAPVAESELIELCEIIDQLVESKYTADPDGDRPIDYCVIDRTTCEPMYFRSLPYRPDSNKSTTARDIVTDAIRFEVAKDNLELAMGQMRDTIRPIQEFVKELAQNAAEMESEKRNDNSPVDRLGV
jgi:hypothetical protein